MVEIATGNCGAAVLASSIGIINLTGMCIVVIGFRQSILIQNAHTGVLALKLDYRCCLGFTGITLPGIYLRVACGSVVLNHCYISHTSPPIECWAPIMSFLLRGYNTVVNFVHSEAQLCCDGKSGH